MNDLFERDNDSGIDMDELKSRAILQALLSGKGNPDDDGNELCVSSIPEAIALLENHMAAGEGKYRQNLVQYIVNPANKVMGDCDIIHNLIMSFFRCGDYTLAIKICDYALQFSPKNRDIIADAIKACGDSSQFDLGEEYIKRAEEISYERWTWRLYLYTVDFLKSKLDSDPDNTALYERTEALANRYIEQYPADEHGYNQKGELYIQTNQRKKAIDFLKETIMTTQPEEDARTGSELICPQCCVTLLNILDDSNEYDLIVEICERGLRYTAQEQPSAKIGFFQYRKAEALDAKAYREDFKDAQLLEKVLVCYQSAYDLNQDREYRYTIEQRYAALRVPAGQKQVEFKPLVKRNLYETEGGQ